MLVGRVLEVIDRSCHAGHLPAYLPKNHAAVRLILTYQPRRPQPVPPFYLVRAANGFFVAGGDARKRRSDFLPAFGSALGAAGSASDSISIRWRPDRHAREPSNGTQRCSGRDPLVPMMEPTDPGKRHNLSGTAGLNRSPLGGVLAQRKMRPGSVVVFEVRNKDPSQMSFIQDDHMVQAFAPHAADEAFRIRILPRASWAP